jgi:hypothetical protein
MVSAPFLRAAGSGWRDRSLILLVIFNVALL